MLEISELSEKNIVALPFSVTKEFTVDRACSFSCKTQQDFNIYRDLKIDVVEET